MPAFRSSDVPARSTRWLYAASVLAPAFAAIAITVLAAAANADWYETLAVPSFDPPMWLSVAVWALADLVMASAAYRVLCRPDWMPDRPRAIRSSAVYAGLVMAWPAAFFGAQSPAAGLVVILAVLVGAIVTGRLFAAVDRRAGMMVMLQGCWIGFAALLALSIFIRA